mmetsp:Transcript_10136/g.8887  ORF Transcript_10136/g.8887 Transcript_10136/m.8887 type:complete len:95 (+) Transcript_10136:475-759(+)
MDRTIRIWDAKSGTCLKELKGHTDSVISAFFNHDGSQVFSASIDKTIRIWDTMTGSLIRVVIGHTESINSAQFNLYQGSDSQNNCSILGKVKFI